MSTGGDDFQFTDDTVVAKLSIDVPAGSAESLRQINQQAEQLRVELEAIARAESNWIDYLEQVPQLTEQAAAAQRNLITQLERTSYLQQQLGSAGMPGFSASVGIPGQAPYSTAAPAGYSDPFSGAVAGLGTAGRVPSTGPVGSVAEASNSADLISHLAQTDPQMYANMAAQRGLGGGKITSALKKLAMYSMTGLGTDTPGSGAPGMGKGGPTPTAGTTPGKAFDDADTEELAKEMAKKVENEQAAGLGNHPLLSQALGSAANLAGRAGLGGAARMGMGLESIASGGTSIGLMGKLGMAGTAIAGAGLASQNIGEWYQGVKNLGSVRGGGFAQGAAYEAEARMMSLNPFIDLQQSREIMQAGLREGYTGKTFDTITSFMASNLKNMNLAQPYSAFVLTPSGWAKMGDLAVGDQVTAGDGTPTEVVKISERGVCEVYEVGFSDGTSARCTMDHLWLVYQTNEKTPRVMFLKDLVARRRKNSSGLFRSNGAPRYRVPSVDPAHLGEQRLPIDRKRTKAITSVTRVLDEECRCIQVSHPDQLYVTDDYTVTHNSVSDSVALLRTNVDKGKMSVTDLGKALMTLREESKTGRVALPEKVKQYQQTSEALAAKGMEGERLSRTANQIGQMFPKDAVLSKLLDQSVQSAVNNPGFLMTMGMVNQVPGYTTPDTVFMAMDEANMDPVAGIMNTLEWFANQARATSGGNEKQAIASFMQLGSEYGFPMDYSEAKKLYKQLVGGGAAEAVSRSANDAAAAEKKAAENEQKRRNSISGKVGRALGTVAKPLTNFVKTTRDFLKGEEGGASFGDVVDSAILGGALTMPWEHPEDKQKVEAPDPSFEYQRINQPTPSAQRQTRTATQAPAPTVPTQVTGTVNGNLHITVDPQTGRIQAPPTVALSGHQKAVNSGYGGATINNPSPGDPAYNHSYTGWDR